VLNPGDRTSPGFGLEAHVEDPVWSPDLTSMAMETDTWPNGATTGEEVIDTHTRTGPDQPVLAVDGAAQLAWQPLTHAVRMHAALRETDVSWGAELAYLRATCPYACRVRVHVPACIYLPSQCAVPQHHTGLQGQTQRGDLASGSLTLDKAGTGTVAIKLSARARRLIEQRGSLWVVGVESALHGHRSSIQLTRTFPVRPPSVVSIAAPTGARLASPIMLSGTLGLVRGLSGKLMPGPDQTVFIHASSPLGQAVRLRAKTDSAGYYSVRFYFGLSGAWHLLSAWSGDARHEPGASAMRTVDVAPPQATRLSVRCPSAASAGVASTIVGTLQGAPAGATVSLVYRDKSSAAVIHEVSPGRGGEFKDSFVPSRRGLWTLTAQFTPTLVSYAPASSSCKVQVG
jgi:hypothetical protein